MKKVLISPRDKSFDLICDEIAPDKSISHRCAIFSLLSNESSKIKNFLEAEDTLASLNIAKQLGADIDKKEGSFIITPPKKIQEPFDVLDCGNAGTAIRLYMGLLSANEGSFVLSGDQYLRRRPMGRVVKPLREIGAKIDGREYGNKAPIHIRGAKLKAFSYHSPINSAQVKSALILAALFGDDKSYYKENLLSRDHTERMLRGMGADIKEVEKEDGVWIEITPLSKPLKPLDIRVPADPSSGFFFAVAAAITPGSRVVIKDVTLNPTRVEAYKKLQEMGAYVKFTLKEDIYEPIGDIEVSYNGALRAIKVSQNIAWLIDELPALSIAMAVAKGVSEVKNAKELRVKESDRIASVISNLKEAGIECEEFSDGYKIKGGVLKEAKIKSYGDHRVAMSFAIAALLAKMEIEDIECVNTSFPNFFAILQKIAELKIED